MESTRGAFHESKGENPEMEHMATENSADFDEDETMVVETIPSVREEGGLGNFFVIWFNDTSFISYYYFHVGLCSEEQPHTSTAVPLQLIDTKKSEKRSAKKKKKNRSERKRKNPVDAVATLQNSDVTPAKRLIRSFKIPKISDSIQLPQDHQITLGDIDVAFG